MSVVSVRHCPCRGPGSSPCRLDVLLGDTLCGYHRELFDQIDARSVQGLGRELAEGLDLPFVLPADWDDLEALADTSDDTSDDHNDEGTPLVPLAALRTLHRDS